MTDMPDFGFLELPSIPVESPCAKFVEELVVRLNQELAGRGIVNMKVEYIVLPDGAGEQVKLSWYSGFASYTEGMDVDVMVKNVMWELGRETGANWFGHLREPAEVRMRRDVADFALSAELHDVLNKGSVNMECEIQWLKETAKTIEA